MSMVYLVGFMGVGKSTVGRKLASTMGYDFVDLDDLFEETYKISIDNFFSKYGEKLFRDLEHRLLLTTFRLKKTVVSTGGGTPCFFNAMEKMNTAGITVHLEMPVGGIIQRLSNAKRKRPLVTGKASTELEDFVNSRLEERKQFYESAVIRADALDIDIEDLAKRIILKIQ